MPAVITVLNAGESYDNYSGLAQREMVRRQNDVAEADRLLAAGREAYAKGDERGGDIAAGVAKAYRKIVESSRPENGEPVDASKA